MSSIYQHPGCHQEIVYGITRLGAGVRRTSSQATRDDPCPLDKTFELYKYILVPGKYQYALYACTLTLTIRTLRASIAVVSA